MCTQKTLLISTNVLTCVVLRNDFKFNQPCVALPLVFTVRKRSLRRLCFHRCLSVHGGGVLVSVRGVSIPGGSLPKGGLSPGGLWPAGLCPGGSLSRGGLRILLECILVRKKCILIYSRLYAWLLNFKSIKIYSTFSWRDRIRYIIPQEVRSLQWPYQN